MRILVFLAASVAGAIMASAAASAATVSPTGVRAPDIAVNASGATVVAWSQLTRNGSLIEARVGRSPAKLGPIQRMSPSRAFDPQVAVGASGTAVVAWYHHARRGNALRVAIAPRGRAFGRSRVIGVDVLSGADVAVQPNGRVVAAFESRGKLRYALAARGKGFGKARSLGPASQASMAMDPSDGSITLIYDTYVPAIQPDGAKTVVRTLPQAAPRFSAEELLRPSAESPRPSKGPAGSAVAFPVGQLGELQVVRRFTDGSWADVGRIAAAPGPSPDLLGINAAVLGDGAVLATWFRAEPSPSNRHGGANQAFASLGMPGAGFGPRRAITPAGADFGYPQVAAAGDEGFVAAAERNGGRVLLSTRAPGAASVGAPVTLSRTGDGDVLLAAAGRHVLVAYQRNDRLQLKVVR